MPPATDRSRNGNPDIPERRHRDRADIDMLVRRVGLQVVDRSADRGLETSNRASRAVSWACPVHPRQGTAASRIPSPRDWNFSARHRGAPCHGNSGSSSPRLSRYSQINWLPNSDNPSSVTRHGTFESGLSATRSGGRSVRVGRYASGSGLETADDRACHDFPDIRTGRRVIEFHGGCPLRIVLLRPHAGEAGRVRCQQERIGLHSSPRTDGTLGCRRRATARPCQRSRAAPALSGSTARANRALLSVIRGRNRPACPAAARPACAGWRTSPPRVPSIRRPQPRLNRVSPDSRTGPSGKKKLICPRVCPGVSITCAVALPRRTVSPSRTASSSFGAGAGPPRRPRRGS